MLGYLYNNLTVHITNLTVQQHTTHWRSRDTIVTMHTNAQWAQCTAAHILRDKYEPCPPPVQDSQVFSSRTSSTLHFARTFILCCRLQFHSHIATTGADPNILHFRLSPSRPSRISPKFKSGPFQVIDLQSINGRRVYLIHKQTRVFPTLPESL